VEFCSPPRLLGSLSLRAPWIDDRHLTECRAISLLISSDQRGFAIFGTCATL
jgi:hypothetical protein